MSAAASLTAFQHSFLEALGRDAGAGDEAPFAGQPGFAVYRNTVRLACIEALRANYPTVEQLVGKAWFGDAATIFVSSHWPQDGVLAHYGEGFAEFLGEFDPARALAYLPDIARLDRCWTDAHLAADAPALAAASLGALSPAALAEARLVVHPAARWATFATMPAYTIWRRHREALSLDDALSWRGESALIVRPLDVVAWHAIGAAAVAFLAASAQGASVGTALGAADAADDGAKVGDWLPALVEAGAFTRLARE